MYKFSKGDCGLERYWVKKFDFLLRRKLFGPNYLIEFLSVFSKVVVRINSTLHPRIIQS